MTTFRKLPTISPITNTEPANHAGYTAYRAAMSVNMRWRAPRAPLADDLTELEDRQVHRDHHAADEHAEDGHDERLEQARHAVDRVVDLRLVKNRHPRGHGVKRPRLFTHRDHLHDHVRKQARVIHGTLQPLAGGHLVLHAQHRLLVNNVAAGAGHRAHGLDQWHAGGEHGRQRARKARDGSFLQNGSDDGELEQEAIERELHLFRTFEKIEKRIDAAAGDQPHPPALVLYGPREIHDHLRKR